jgi:hypothetical protein
MNDEDRKTPEDAVEMIALPKSSAALMNRGRHFWGGEDGGAPKKWWWHDLG